MKNLVFILCLFNVLFCSNTIQANEPISPYGEYSLIIQKASFPGGSEALHEYIKTNLVYPDLAREYGIEGEVKLSIRLSATGIVQAIRVVKAIGFGCDEEAVRLIKSGPAWVPALDQGEMVVSQVILSIHFELL